MLISSYYQAISDHRSQLSRYAAPFRIGLSPVTLLTGFFVLFIYGWAVGLGIEVSIFLQTPEVAGGYGFTPLQNASCKLWLTLFAVSRMC